MKRVALAVALVMGLGISQAHAQMDQAESLQKQNVFGKVISDIKESARTVHEISKENLAAEKEMSRMWHEKAIEPSPEFEKFKQANGLKNKTQVVIGNFKDSCKEYSEKESERRSKIKSQDFYRTLMEELRKSREAIINYGYKG